MERHVWESYWDDVFQSLRKTLRQQLKTKLRFELTQKQKNELDSAPEKNKKEIREKQTNDLEKFDKVSVNSTFEFGSLVDHDNWLELEEQLKINMLGIYKEEYFCMVCHKGGIPEIRFSSFLSDSGNRSFNFDGYNNPTNLTKCNSCGDFFCSDHLCNGSCRNTIKVHHHHYY